MKYVGTLLGFLLKIILISIYICTRGLEMFLHAFNNTFQKLLGK